MNETEWYYVKNWWKFQDYRFKKPPWIRLWTELIEDPQFFDLSEIDQWRLVRLWMYASEMDGRLPRDHRQIRRRLSIYHAKIVDDLVAILLSKSFISIDDTRGIRRSNLPPETETETDVKTQPVALPEIKPRKAKPPFEKPTLHQVVLYMQEIGVPDPEFQAEGFMANHESKGWRIGRNPMVSWKAAVQTWKHNIGVFPGNGSGHKQSRFDQLDEEGRLEELKNGKPQ